MSTPVPGILGNYEMDAEQTIGPCPRQSRLGQVWTTGRSHYQLRAPFFYFKKKKFLLCFSHVTCHTALSIHIKGGYKDFSFRMYECGVGVRERHPWPDCHCLCTALHCTTCVLVIQSRNSRPCLFPPIVNRPDKREHSLVLWQADQKLEKKRKPQSPGPFL